MGAEAALVGLVGALLGVALSNLFIALQDGKRRRERQLDLVFAIHAEISAGLGANQKLLTAEEVAYALADETPFQTPDDTDFVFSSIKSDISLLPNPVIHSVVQYYRFAMQTNLMTVDLRHPAFDKQGKAEKRKFMTAVLEVAAQQRQSGLQAVRELEQFARDQNQPIPPQIDKTDPVSPQQLAVTRKDE